jgi:hypothetical protein
MLISSQSIIVAQSRIGHLVQPTKQSSLGQRENDWLASVPLRSGRLVSIRSGSEANSYLQLGIVED